MTLEIDLSIHNKYMHALSYKYPKAFIWTDNFSFSTQLKAPKYAITSLMDLPSMLRVNMDMPQDRPYFTWSENSLWLNKKVSIWCELTNFMLINDNR